MRWLHALIYTGFLQKDRQTKKLEMNLDINFQKILLLLVIITDVSGSDASDQSWIKIKVFFLQR